MSVLPRVTATALIASVVLLGGAATASAADVHRTAAETRDDGPGNASLKPGDVHELLDGDDDLFDEDWAIQDKDWLHHFLGRDQHGDHDGPGDRDDRDDDGPDDDGPGDDGPGDDGPGDGGPGDDGPDDDGPDDDGPGDDGPRDDGPGDED